MKEQANENFVMSEWRLLSQTKEQTRRTLFGFAVATLVLFLLAFIPSLAVELRLIFVTFGIGTIFGVLFEWRHLRRDRRIYEAFRFDHRRMEHLSKEDDCAPEILEVLAFDALSYVNISNDDIYLQPIGHSPAMIVELNMSSREDFSFKLVEHLKTKEIPVHFVDQKENEPAHG